MTAQSPSHQHYTQCVSTNDIARAWALGPTDPALHGALVTSDYQTAGRGRRGRTWNASPGESVLMSVVLRPTLALPDAWQLGFLAALAAADALSEDGVAPHLKWPNDVLLAGRKVAGVLVETVLSPPSVGAETPWAAVVGIGLNVNQSEFSADDRLLYPATSLRLTTGRVWDIPLLTASIHAHLLARVEQRVSEGWPTVLNAYRRCLAPSLVLRRGGDEAILVDVDEAGHARVHLPDGTFAVWPTLDEYAPETPPHGV